MTVTYDPVLRREDDLLPANIVPALLAQEDGGLWVGSALGLAQLRTIAVESFQERCDYGGDRRLLLHE